MAWMPGAIRKEIPKHNRRTTSLRNRTNLHVAVSEASSLYGYFSGAGVCSHFYVRKDGTIEQYVSTVYYSAADYQGNDATISVETQGGVHDAQGEPWTGEQITALAKIVAWVHLTHPSIPVRLAVDSRKGESSKGVSWHRLGIDPWRVVGGMRYSTSRGKVCPGNAKIAQIPEVVALARTFLDMELTPVSDPHPQGNGGAVKNYLTRGDVGGRVKELQQLLNARGYRLVVDGSFGPATLAAVRSFQMAANLVIDGFAGPATMAALRTSPPVTATLGTIKGRNYLKRGDVGEVVKTLQRMLNTKGARLAIDGSFGPATEQAVRNFQRSSGLVVDGLAGPATQAALNKPTAPKPVTRKASSTTSLSRGSSGQAVRDLQVLLNRVYPAYSRLVVDGLFGPATEAVVREFQRRAGITVDGSVGPQTRKALGL